MMRSKNNPEWMSPSQQSSANLIAELRKIGDAYLDEFPTFKAQEICPQAADAIERLTAELTAERAVVRRTAEAGMEAVAERDRLLEQLSDMAGLADKLTDATDENARLRAALERATSAMDGVTVFISSRDQIRQPEGLAWWREEITAAREALSSCEAPSLAGGAVENIVRDPDWRAAQERKGGAEK